MVVFNIRIIISIIREGVRSMSKEALWRAVKEPLRLLVMAIVSWLLAEVLPFVKGEWVPIIILILRFADKYLHELGKERSTTRSVSPLVKGLTRF